MGVRAGQRQELANSIRQKHRKETQRQRMVLAILVTIGVLASAASLVWLQVRGSQDDATADIVSPQNATDNYGFTLTTEMVTDAATTKSDATEVIIYEDFLCPTCKTFHERSGEYLAEQLTAGNISITYYPIAFLVSASTDEYSQRATNAAVCVADQAGILAYSAMHELLMANQPAQGGPGLTDEQLIGYAAEIGAGDISDCVTNRTFDLWVEAALKEAKRVDVTATPTVRIDGSNVFSVSNGKETIPGPAELKFVLEGES